MTYLEISTNITDWQQNAQKYLEQGKYVEAAELYEQAIILEPEVKSHYWHLGLMLLLQGQETEAQMTWLMGMTEEDSEQIQNWTTELIEVLHIEAERQVSLSEYQIAYAIRQHINEIAPTDLNNQLHLLLLSIELETFTYEYLAESGIIDLLKAKESVADLSLLFLAMQKIVNSMSDHPNVLGFTEACLNYVPEPDEFVHAVMLASTKLAYSGQRPSVASRLAEFCLNRNPNNPEVLNHLSVFYQNSYQYLPGIETAKRCYEITEPLANKIYANYLVIRALMSASGYWDEVCSRVENHKSLILALIEEWDTHLDPTYNLRLFNSPFFFSYVNDDPATNRFFHNQIARLCYENLKNSAKDLIAKCNYSTFATKDKLSTKKVLKIGYISHCLRRHSVGWISRWLFAHHDPEKVEVYIYLIGSLSINDFEQQWFVNNSYKTYRFEVPNSSIVERIREDEIDILVELDSITLDTMCEVLSIKPAPIQVTWLGWDASGLPAVDYFIADPYVVPENAQDYYTEKIWRLPQTYVAVDGFEVGIPTLRREDLDIPKDAVIYFVAQKGYKRHLDNVRSQMQIIKAVPNSYLLIKGVADEDSTIKFFEQVAEEVGVEKERLRFLKIDRSEEEHRANLGIADIVLDTYPYNGATTTLETLWMGIPLVTQVGQQFSARNTYTMMINVGVTEGISWNVKEYIEWGIRLGKDADLRQQIAWKLRQSRQTAPLWNGKQFARDMEQAYEQMWEIYCQSPD